VHNNFHNLLGAHPPQATDPSMQREKVGVRSIRLHDPAQQTRAVLCSFHSADQALADWATRRDETFMCEFEVVYSDGYQISGIYLVKGKSKTRPALTRHLLASTLAVQELSHEYAIQGLRTSDFAFSERYEIGDSLQA